METLDAPKRTTLQELRQTIRGISPDAEECISYGMPAMRQEGAVIAGFAAFRDHLSYLPHSGSVLAQLPDDLASYVTSKGALQFPIDQPLPEALVKKLIAIRLKEVSQRLPDRRSIDPSTSPVSAPDAHGRPGTRPLSSLGTVL